MRICSKFLKYEASHKNIVIVDFLMLVALRVDNAGIIFDYNCISYWTRHVRTKTS